MTEHTIPVARPFNRAEHCRRIAAHGGAATVARHGTAHMRAIGTAGAQVTIRKHGVGYWRGLVQAKGWHGRRPVSLAVDLAAGRVDAALAAAKGGSLALYFDDLDEVGCHDRRPSVDYWTRHPGSPIGDPGSLL